MAAQTKDAIKSVKQYWAKLTPKRKKILAAMAAGILIFSLGMTLYLNSRNDGYVDLYSNIDTAESAEIYKTLQEMGVTAQLDAAGKVQVPIDQADRLLIELSGLGYPKSAPTYDIFSSNSSFTTTEFEKKQYLLFQLQDRIEQTLMHIDGVKSAIVTLDVPQGSNYVWEEETKGTGSASVLIEMAKDRTLSPAKVAAIKNLVASSVPKMEVADVVVVDALTSLEMRSLDEAELDSGFNLDRLDFESQIENRMVDKVLNVLSIGYLPEDVRVSAAVVIDYKKMISEQMDYVPGENGQGVPYHLSEGYAMSPEDATAQGVAGEENNTDVPIYVDANNDGVPEYVYHTRNVDSFVSYMKQQIEKDKAELQSASLSISVDDPGLTPIKRDSIVALAAKATNVLPENITVESLSIVAPLVVPGEPEPPVTEVASVPFWKTPLFLAIAGGILLFLLILGFIFFVVIRNKKRKLAKIEAEKELALVNAQQQLEDEKRKLRDLAVAQSDKDNEITEEVRQFANANPEITASLLRSWLKEGE